MLVQQRGSLSSKSGKYSWEVPYMCWKGDLFQIGVQIGKQADDSVFGVGCTGDGGVVVWVSTLPLGRPIALTLGPPLNLPLGRQMGMARGMRLTRCCGTGVLR